MHERTERFTGPCARQLLDAVTRAISVDVQSGSQQQFGSQTRARKLHVHVHSNFEHALEVVGDACGEWGERRASLSTEHTRTRQRRPAARDGWRGRQHDAPVYTTTPRRGVLSRRLRPNGDDALPRRELRGAHG